MLNLLVESLISNTDWRGEFKENVRSISDQIDIWAPCGCMGYASESHTFYDYFTFWRGSEAGCISDPAVDGASSSSTFC